MCVAAGFYLPLRIFSCLTALAFLSLLLLDDEKKETEGATREMEQGEPMVGRDSRPKRRNQRERSSRSSVGRKWKRGKKCSPSGIDEVVTLLIRSAREISEFPELPSGRAGIVA